MLRKTTLSLDEYEAIRLKDLLGMEQEDAAHAMGISQPTFHRILRCARKKVADALVNSRALHIEGGNVTMEEKRIFRCGECRHEWALPYGTGRPEKCPHCGSENIHRHPEDKCNKGPGKRECRKTMCRNCTESRCDATESNDK